MIDRFELLALTVRIILDDDLERPQHRHAPLRDLVEMFADRKIEHAGVNHAVGLGDADALDEFADGRGRHAAAAQSGKRRHARIVPAVDMSAAHEFSEHALRQNGVGQVEPREFVLMRIARAPADCPIANRKAAGDPRIRACTANA